MPTQAVENQPILIASCSLDSATWEPVARDLTRRGHEVILFEADKVALGTVAFEINMHSKETAIYYDNKELCLNAIKAAWFRRPSSITNPREDGIIQMSLDLERRLLQTILWDELPENRWLNSPEHIRLAEKKLSQLSIAAQLGFNIPETVVTNHWKSIEEKLPSEIICKSSYSLFNDGEDFKTLYSTPFANEKTKLPVDHNPFPGIWQPHLEKAKEWRITAVGDETFDAAIYTATDAKDDWRKHQNLPGMVEFKRENFPDELKEKCFQYLGRLGLKFGAFDFIEDNDGNITFLECNPNGQYMWLEETLRLPISQAIADELVNIATSDPSR